MRPQSGHWCTDSQAFLLETPWGASGTPQGSSRKLRQVSLEQFGFGSDPALPFWKTPKRGLKHSRVRRMLLLRTFSWTGFSLPAAISLRAWRPTIWKALRWKSFVIGSGRMSFSKFGVSSVENFKPTIPSSKPENLHPKVMHTHTQHTTRQHNNFKGGTQGRRSPSSNALSSHNREHPSSPLWPDLA